MSPQSLTTPPSWQAEIDAIVAGLSSAIAGAAGAAALRVLEVDALGKKAASRR